MFSNSAKSCNSVQLLTVARRSPNEDGGAGKDVGLHVIVQQLLQELRVDADHLVLAVLHSDIDHVRKGLPCQLSQTRTNG